MGDPINWRLCILCQRGDKKEGPLVLKPRLGSYVTCLNAVRERATCNDGQYVEIERRLKDVTRDTLSEQGAIWHRSCYQEATNRSRIERARERNEQAVSAASATKKRGRKRKSEEIEQPSERPAKFTRSKTAPLEKDLCFFCQEDTGEQIFRVCTSETGKQLRSAVEKSGNPALVTRLNTSISPTDAHAIDVQYHKGCWRSNVFHSLREVSDRSGPYVHPLQAASMVEITNLVEVKTRQKAVISMGDVETVYKNMLGDVMAQHCPTFSRKWLKEYILTELPAVTSVLQKDRRKSAVLYNPTACQEDNVHSMIIDAGSMDNMKTVFKAAQIIRQSIVYFNKESVTDNDDIPVSSDTTCVPAELYSLMRWVLTGPVEHLATEARTGITDRLALTMSQNMMFGLKTDRQVQYKPSGSGTFRQHRTKENPQVVGLALSLHSDTRSKKLLELLNRQGLCVSHGRTLQLETALANAVVENTKNFGGLYIPPFLKKGSFVFLAADNIDFSEDTPDGKCTTHGTIVAVYQKRDALGETVAPSLSIKHTSSQTVQPYHLQIEHCEKPKPVQNKREKEFVVNEEGINTVHQRKQMSWIIACVLSRLAGGPCKIPCWAGYNSLTSNSLPLTQIGALPLMPEVAHEWSTLLTVLKQANAIRKFTVGDDHPTVITFDMALYEKVVQLLDARPDLKKSTVPRLGELHAVMAALRALGSSIENSGIDDAWIEAGLYGTATTRQILSCSHYKRCLTAHIYTYIAFYELILEEFFNKYPQLKATFDQATEQVTSACCHKDKSVKEESVKQANSSLQDIMAKESFEQAFETWKKTKCKNVMFAFITNYLCRVEAILHFIAASRNADWELHLEAAESLSKLFFAFDRIKYKRLWPRYIADMKDLKTNHPNTWSELASGNVSVTRSAIPFVSVGADHACEHINRQMKVHSGLTGISNNANARQRFFMAAAELSCLSIKFKDQFNTTDTTRTEHPGVTQSSIQRDHAAVDSIKATILSHGNPVRGEGDQLYNIITGGCIPQEHVHDILHADSIGQKLYEDFVADRINGDVRLWATVKKEKLKTFTSNNKKSIIKLQNTSIELKETKDLYRRLLVLSRSRDIDQKKAIGTYEFTQVPRALFASDGEILPCTDKSKLIHRLEKLVEENAETENLEAAGAEQESGTSQKHHHRIALVDGMVILHNLTKKPPTMETVGDLSRWYYDRVMGLACDYDEIIVVFDTYKPESLKQRTRERRNLGQLPVEYQIKDETNIKNITMNKFLSHYKTKKHLTEYLADKIIEYAASSPKVVIVSAAGK